MKLKILANNVLNFGVNRVIEIVGVAILITGVLLLTSLITFSPDDPNFIFPNDTKIKNILGFHGSFTADIFFQSFGILRISFLKNSKLFLDIPIVLLDDKFLILFL